MPSKYLLSFWGLRTGEPAARHHNLASPIPDCMQGVDDAAVEAYALLLILGTKQFTDVTNISVEEE